MPILLFRHDEQDESEECQTWRGIGLFVFLLLFLLLAALPALNGVIPALQISGLCGPGISGYVDTGHQSLACLWGKLSLQMPLVWASMRARPRAFRLPLTRVS